MGGVPLLLVGEGDVACEGLDGAVFSTAEVAILLVCSVMEMMEEEVILLLPFEDTDTKDSADLSGQMAARFGSSDPLEADKNMVESALPGGMVESALPGGMVESALPGGMVESALSGEVLPRTSTCGGKTFWRADLEEFR